MHQLHKSLAGTAGWAGICITLACASAAEPNLVSARTGLPIKSRDPNAAVPAGLTSYFGGKAAVRATEHFVIVHDNDPTWASRAAAVLECTYARMFKELDKSGFTLRDPSGPMICLAFRARGDFDRYSRAADRVDLPHLNAYYSARTGRTALWCRPDEPERAEPEAKLINVAAVEVGADAATLATLRSGGEEEKLAHEAAHQLTFGTGLLTRGVMYPLWVAEGLAMQFECNQGLAAESPNAARRRRLLDANSDGRTLSFESFVTLTRVQNRDASDVYAQAWGTFAFLFKERRQALAQYLVRMNDLPPGQRTERQVRAEFEKAFGDPKTFEKAWLGYLGTLSAEEHKVSPLAAAP